MNLPELRRARKEWLTRPRLLLGAMGSVGLAWLLSANASSHNPGSEITWEILIIQHLILFFYGISSLINDFIDEHRRNSWDLLALTPLSASEVVFGKLAASTSYAVYLALVLAPWALWAQMLPGAKGFAHLFLQWAWLGTTFLASAFLSLAAAAATARLQGGKLGIGGAALGALGL
ncbi:MAG: hypothetical protein HYV15_03680, partial [Elusimicrobia bacterium]|nr:hypothetical protein [Elusimicrobiota bacterium]